MYDLLHYFLTYLLTLLKAVNRLGLTEATTNIHSVEKSNKISGRGSQKLNSSYIMRTRKHFSLSLIHI